MKIKYLILLLLSIVSGFLSSQDFKKISDRIFELEGCMLYDSTDYTSMNIENYITH